MSTPLRALFLVPWPSEAASTRLRVEQYFPYLRANGVEPIIRPFMGSSLYGMVYKSGHLETKTASVLASAARRFRDVVTAAQADVVFIHREAFPFGTTVFEQMIAGVGTPIVFDFDDAIYLATSSEPNNFVRYLKSPDKVANIIKLSAAVVVGNNHLARYARRFHKEVAVVPTPVDTDVYRPLAEPRDSDTVVIGWIGSGTTSRYLNVLREPLLRLAAKHPQVRFSFVGGRSEHLSDLPNSDFHPWSMREELNLLHQFHIGLMPYPDDEWARGKCAFKALLYMSVGVPAVCSAVGMAEEIIRSGENGYLARTQDDWFNILDELVEDRVKRRTVGMAGRELAESEFSLARHAPQVLRILTDVAAGRRLLLEGSRVAHPQHSLPENVLR